MQNHDDKYPARPGSSLVPPGYKPRAVDTNEPSGPASMAYA